MSMDRPTLAGSGYVDLQLNGYAGIDFNDDSFSPEDMHNVCERVREEGVAGFLPTIITDDLDAMAARLARLVAMRQADSLLQKMIVGFHIEGPFISAAPGYVGAHPADKVRPPNVSDAQRLLEAADGLTRIVTLAPELDQEFGVTRFLADQGITVAAGHCDPSFDQLEAAIDSGLSMFTHLGNGCHHHIPRHDNIIERTLSFADKLWISFIADGAHVPFFALRNYLRAAGFERCVIVSDAISAAGLGPGRYQVAGQEAIVGEDRVPRSAEGSHFVGSATSLPQMAENLRQHLHMLEEDVLQLTSIGPRSVLGIT